MAMGRFAGKVHYEEFTLPNGETVLIRPLTASEAKDVGVGSGRDQNVTGEQMRAIIIAACKEPQFVAEMEPTNGAVSIFALTAADEIALMNRVLEISYKPFMPKEAVAEQPFPAGGVEDSPGLRPITPGVPESSPLPVLDADVREPSGLSG